MSEPREILEQYTQEIERIQGRTQEKLRGDSGARLYYVWGLIWLAGYALSFTQERWLFSPSTSSGHPWWHVVAWHWWLLIPLGVWYTVRASRRESSVTYRSTQLEAKFGAFWGVLYLYAFVGGLIIFPLIEVSRIESLTGSRVIAAVGALVPMFAYVMLGLFLSRLMLISGLTITVLILVGFYALPSWFQLWMAIVGSTGLFCTGILAKKEALRQPRELFNE